MMLRPQTVQLLSMGQTTIVAGGIGGAAATIGLPNIQLWQVETSCSVPDGGTLLIGGHKLAGEVRRDMGVPVLSEIPVINRAFTNSGELRDEQTLLILVKPRILIQEDLEEDPTLRTEESYLLRFLSLLRMVIQPSPATRLLRRQRPRSEKISGPPLTVRRGTYPLRQQL